MKYTAKTQHCLETMGVVPWVRRNSSIGSAVATISQTGADTQAHHHSAEPLQAPSATRSQPAEQASATHVQQVIEQPSTVQAESPAQSQAGASVGSAEPMASGAIPSALDALGLWLPDQPIQRLKLYDRLVPATGPETAPLLVVVEPDADNDGVSPLHANEAKLFELMMRAIGLSRPDVRVCLLAAGAQEGGEPSMGGVDDAAACVSSVITPAVRAILLLQQDWSAAHPSDLAADHHSLCARPPRPLWRIAHPAVLLQRNTLKRQAWHVLQAVHAAL